MQIRVNMNSTVMESVKRSNTLKQAETVYIWIKLLILFLHFCVKQQPRYESKDKQNQHAT